MDRLHKSASLELIAKANGKLTGDEMRKKDRDDAREKRLDEFFDIGMTSKRRRAIKRMLNRVAQASSEEK